MDKFECSVRVTIKYPHDNASGGFGPGMAQLLTGVRDSHSLNKSAKAMGMAYSKAWKSINSMEDGLGFKLIERNGARGSLLTAEGAEFLEMYERVAARARESALEELAK